MEQFQVNISSQNSNLFQGKFEERLFIITIKLFLDQKFKKYLVLYFFILFKLMKNFQKTNSETGFNKTQINSYN